MRTVRFTVPVVPRQKDRARTGKTRTGKTVVYDTAANKAYARRIAQEARLYLGDLGKLTGPLTMQLTCYFAPPRSWPKAEKQRAIEYALPHVSKPDASNLAKAVEDAMNGIVYDDDAAIFQLIVEKRYALTPGISVTIGELPR